MSHFLVTGGAGFIGSHIAERLLREGHHVRVLDDLSTGKRENLKAGEQKCELITADAANPEVAAAAVKGIDGIFHLAAVPSVPLSIKEPLKNQRAGEVALLAILDAAQKAGVKRIVYTSSSAVYGNSTAPVNHEGLPTAPLNPYALSKLTGEGYCKVFSQLYPALDTVCLRYFNVFGPRQDPSSPYSGVISIFIRCLQEKKAPTIFGDGKQTRDFVEVTNVVEANLLAMNAASSFAGEAFNVATGESVSLLEVWDYLHELSGEKLSPHFAPERAGDIKHSRASIDKIASRLGYKPKVNWQEGLKRLWEHVTSQK
jgi:UDP-glucose 4-epimerase